MKLKLPPEVKANLIELAQTKGVRLEGNILKILDVEEDDPVFADYIRTSLTKDQEFRRKRLDLTKQVQAQNTQLKEAQEKLQKALNEAENAKGVVEQEIQVLQKKTQFHMMRRIVNLAIGVVAAVGFIATAVYVFALIKNREVERIGTVWASLTGILLTNSFSILGTIMGVKYAANKED